jgi:hypothetical protein
MKRFFIFFLFFLCCISCFAQEDIWNPTPQLPNNYIGPNKLKNIYLSAGPTTEPTFIDHGSNVITVNACCISLFDNAEHRGLPKQYNFEPATFTLNVDATNYIVGNYNNGNPILQNITDVELINESNIVPILTIYDKNGFLHSLNWDTVGKGLANKLHQRFVKTDRYRRESGLTMTMSNPGTNLNFTISEGRVWYGATRELIPAINSTTDTILIVYPNGTTSATTALNNMNYYSGSLQTLTNNRYAVNWVYRGVEQQKHVYIMLGSGDYSLTEAQNAIAPAAPSIITSHAQLIAKVIIQKGSNTVTSLQSAYDVTFNLAAPLVHNELSGLNDGDSYEHLTEIEKSQILGLLEGGSDAPLISGGTDWTAPATYDVQADFGIFQRAFTSISAAGSIATYTDGPTHNKGSEAFYGGVMMPNGKVALVPRNSVNVGIYDTIANTYADGPAHGKGSEAFSGGVMMPNGKVAMVPYSSANVGIYDPIANTYTDGPAHSNGIEAFRGGVMMPNGKVALVPYNSTNVGIYDTIANTYTNGPKHNKGREAFCGGVMMPNGKVALVPYKSANVGIYDPIANTYTDGPAHVKGIVAFSGGVMMPNGNVALVPYYSDNIGIYDPIANTYTDGPKHNKGNDAFYGGVMMPNGKVAMVPYSLANVGIYDPIANTYTDGPVHDKGIVAFSGGVMMPNGKVALVPYSSANVGIYDPVCGAFPLGNLLTPFVNKL